jgi:hypothetical protein
VHQSGKKTNILGYEETPILTLLYMLQKRPLHSGHYGNWAPNPAMLAELLASMKDSNGRVTVKDL